MSKPKKPSNGKMPNQVQLKDILISGNPKQVLKAQKQLNSVISLINKLPDNEARLFLQEAIDTYNLSASILFKGHLIWSRKKIISNLNRIIQRGQLYNSRKNKVEWVRMGTMAYLPKVPENFKPILSDYFYQYLTLCCGSDPHYSRAGWIGIYPTVFDLKKFFMMNEKGKAVTEYIPPWKADALKIAKDVERILFPFRSYMKAQREKEKKR
jgi:hypothetical protein